MEATCSTNSLKLKLVNAAHKTVPNYSFYHTYAFATISAQNDEAKSVTGKF
jgi:hypothetical protein